ncbi:MAG: DUF551 domain-containing protein [Klebsiella pneumoniae]|nr:DUF551 domain-containing protein [Klebsiella pneumoniae]
MTSKFSIDNRELLQRISSGEAVVGIDFGNLIVRELAAFRLAAMDSESGYLPLDYLQGHKDGLEWAAQLAEANHPETGDWLYDDPIELAKAIRKGPDMPPVQPVADSEPVIVVGDDGGDALSYRRLIQSFEPGTKLYRHAQPAPVVLDGYVMVPMRLTAENGAKGALSGQFSETKFVNCPECFGDDECETCDGSGRIEITVPVTWTTIKEIWAKGVEHFAAAPQSPCSEPATVPGKWIPVSERMPIEFEAVIAFDGDQVYGEAMYSSDDGFTIDGYEPCDRLNLQNVTHWMSLPAAPQEVKGE